MFMCQLYRASLRSQVKCNVFALPQTLHLSDRDGEPNQLIYSEKRALLHPDTAVISKRQIGYFDVVVGDSLCTEPVEQSDFVVRPDSVAQVIKHLDHGQCLISSPVWIDEQVESALQTGRLMMTFHADSFILRFLDLAAACS